MTLKQKRPGSGTSEIQLLEDKLVIRYSKGSTKTETSINYTTLLADPDYRASADKRLFVAAGFAASMAVSLIYSSHAFRDTAMSAVTVILGLILSGLAAILVRKYYTGRFDLCLFYYGNGAPAFNLNRNQPDQETYEKFVAEVARKIKRSIDELALPNLSGSIALELEKLGMLRERDLLTEEEFSKAKDGLLSQIERGSRTMGFHQL